MTTPKPPVIVEKWPGYIDTADVAKIIRYRLKLLYPGTKFSVRLQRYAGGSSIDVYWTDGPSSRAVDRIIKPYSSKGFDGMIDMAYHKSAWLMPDLSAIYAHSPGTEGSRGTVPAIHNEKPHPDARQVNFGSSYIFSNRKNGKEAVEQAQRETGAKGEVKVWGNGEATFVGETYDDDKVVWQYLADAMA